MKNKKGKKLVVLGAMAALLTLIGVSGSQTYAKYVESTNVTTQSATVAKWGFVLSGQADTSLFGNAYKKSGDFATISSDSTGLAAKGNGGADIVLPGSKGQFTYTIHGQAEVATRVSIKGLVGNDIYLADKEGTPNEYHPIVWSAFDNESNTIAKGTLKDLIDSLETFTKEFSPLDVVNYTVTLCWEWAFDQGTTSGSDYTPKDTAVKDYVDTSSKLNTNEADTMLAILSAHGTMDDVGVGQSLQSGYDYTNLNSKYNAVTETDFSFNVTVEQIQGS